jgi:hypothetical protein
MVALPLYLSLFSRTGVFIEGRGGAAMPSPI